ncbi:hypothetical protein B0H13DRAFT_648224 [Mycena leptocephala]|nr:hypothetical protein B0H13DRAFT_648224 [Mycena leptocephala]
MRGRCRVLARVNCGCGFEAIFNGEGKTAKRSRGGTRGSTKRRSRKEKRETGVLRIQHFKPYPTHPLLLPSAAPGSVPHSSPSSPPSYHGLLIVQSCLSSSRAAYRSDLTSRSELSTSRRSYHPSRTSSYYHASHASRTSRASRALELRTGPIAHLDALVAFVRRYLPLLCATGLGFHIPHSRSSGHLHHSSLRAAFRTTLSMGRRRRKQGVGRKRKEEGGRRKEEGGRRKEEGGRGRGRRLRWAVRTA